MPNARNWAYNLLRRSERFFQTDMVYLAKGGFWLTVGQGVSIVSGLLLAVAFANLLPKEAYGTYQYILSITGILGIFTLTGMGTTVALAAARGSTGVLRQGFHTQIIWSLGIVTAAGASALYYYYQGNTILASSLLVVGILQPFISGFGLYKSYLMGKQLFREGAILESTQKLLPLVSLIITLFLTDDVVKIVIVYFSSHAISLFLAYILVVKRFEASSTTTTNLKSYSKHLSIMNSFGIAAGHLDKVLVWHFLGAIPVAVYTLANIPVAQMKNLSQLTLSLIFPKLAQKSFSELKKSLPYKALQYFFIMGVGVSIYIVAAPHLFNIFFPEYPESIKYSQLLALSLLAAPRKLAGQAFTAHEMKKEQYFLTISTPVLKIVLLLILLPLHGIWGAVYALLATNLYEVASHWYLFSRAKAH